MKLALFLVFNLCSLISSFGQIKVLSPPSGDLLIGVTYLSLTDSSRKELFDNKHISYRNITVKVWYPADLRTVYEPYLENADTVIKYWQFSDEYRNLFTHASKGVDVSRNQRTFPVLIFSHGWGEHFSQNTILMEELASNGYVIFSIAHHYECKFSFYPDGRFYNWDMNSNRLNQIFSEQQNPDAISLFKKMSSAKTTGERLNIFVETNNLMPEFMIEGPKYWADDIIFFIDELEKTNKTNKILKGRLDLNRIGVFGMSMGGMATNEVCVTDKRVKAGVNIDGGLFGPIVGKELDIPYLFLNSQRFSGYGELFAGKSRNLCYSVTIINSDHYNFTDYSLYPIKSTRQLGIIDAIIPIKIMNSTILSFFNKFLMQKDDNNLFNIATNRNVEYVSNEKTY